jgi:putative ABC transport system permease protein
LIIAVAGVQLLISLAARYSPRANEIRLDGMVLGFTLLLSLVVAVILSYAPKLAKEGSLAAWVAAGVNRMSGGVRRQRLQRSLVVAQIAVSVILLTGAGLLTRTMLQLSEVKTGLNTENILTMEVPFDFEAKKDEDSKALFERMQLEVSAIPGVSEVGIGSTMPLRTALAVLDVKADGRPLASGEAIPRADYRTVSPGYFRASGIPLLKGREFAETDGKTSAKVVILNKSLADRLFGDRDPIGQKVAWTGEVLKFIGLSDEWRTVVGVVGDTKDGGLDAAPRGAMFQPMKQEAMFGGGLVIRAQRDPAALASAATRIVRQIVPNDPIENVQTIEQFKSQSVAPRRLNAILVSSFGVLAVIIAAVGIAGVLAFSVSARTNEIGIRMSLGADSARVQRMILGEGGTLLGYGLFLGVAGALIGTRLIRGLLFGVAPNDPATLVGVAVLMVAVGIAACWLPALRAARIDPAVAIRRQ